MPTAKESQEVFYPEDLLGYQDRLTQGELKVLKKLREELETHVRPILNESYEKAILPREEILRAFKNANIMADPGLFEGREDPWRPRQIYNVFLYLELARFDPSVATFFTVHGGLGYNTILIGGSEDQVEKYGSLIRNFEAQTCFGLTEPDHGSDIAGGLATTAERQGDTWILRGEKRWIGGAKTADFIPIFARDLEDKKIKCFLVKPDAPGLRIENIQQKIALRLVNNGHIYLDGVEVAEADRLPHIHGYRKVAEIFTHTRTDVAHIAMGTGAGAYNAALAWTSDRQQFGQKLASFQLVQERLARMQANVAASLAMSVQVAEIQEQGRQAMVNSSLAKMHNTLRMRESVALAREVCGGDGITLGTDVARFFTDAEAIYTYEGTYDINALLVGREITGLGAFV